MVQRQARFKARAAVGEVVQSMSLEDQAVDRDVVAEQIDDVAQSLVDRRHLWSEPDRPAR